MCVANIRVDIIRYPHFDALVNIDFDMYVLHHFQPALFTWGQKLNRLHRIGLELGAWTLEIHRMNSWDPSHVLFSCLKSYWPSDFRMQQSNSMTRVHNYQTYPRHVKQNIIDIDGITWSEMGGPSPGSQFIFIGWGLGMVRLGRTIRTMMYGRILSNARGIRHQIGFVLISTPA